MPPVAVRAPGTSSFPDVVEDSFSARGVRKRMKAAIGTFTKKIHRHEIKSTSMPPSRRPTAPPAPAIEA